MLTKNQILEIREHLEKAQNPLFFFDNDPDGLCSFLLLQRYIKRGRGVPIKTFPDLTKEYFRKVNELNADYIFILDKPSVSKDFFEEARQVNIPLVWIDHHEIERESIPSYVSYYNPLYVEDKENVPTTHMCYEISEKKDDLWLSVVGCISDRYLPSYYPQFFEKFPDLGIDSDNVFDIFYKSEIGRIANIFSYALKDRITNVISMIRFLMNVKTPYEILEEGYRNQQMHKRFFEINSKLTKLLLRAKEKFDSKSKVLFFEYGGEMSISSDLSNELNYLYPDKIVVVVYLSGSKANISARGEKVREIILEAISDISDARGGGHEMAVGAQVKLEDLDFFKKKVFDIVDKFFG